MAQLVHRYWYYLSNIEPFLLFMKKNDIDYRDLLKCDSWKEKAKEIKEWDRGVCQLCGDSSNLQVHHLCYDEKRWPWDYPKRALVTLCEKCHKKIHENDKKYYERIHELTTKLGMNGVSKDVILTILYNVLKQSEKYKENNIFEKVCDCSPYSIGFLIFGREHKNNIYERDRERDKAFLTLARKAYEWNTGKKDFSEDAAFDGEYYDDIAEYKREFNID